MISIIVSSYNEGLFEKFSTNVDLTIGVEYEIVKIENLKKMGICEAYNIGAAQAKYDFLCFSHEDILFRNTNWGSKLIEEFQNDKSIGLIGVAGGKYKSYVPSGWFSLNAELNHDNVSYQNNQILKAHDEIKKNYDVRTLDGCFIATTYRIWKDHKFDDSIFKRFHCYDLDFSLNVGQKYRLIVSKNILITHLSQGNFDQEWLIETYKLHKKWRSTLPRKYNEITKKEIRNLETNQFLNLMNTTFQIKGNMIKIIAILFSFKTLRLFGIKNWVICILKSINRVKYLAVEKRRET